jgi:hypothetical protein
MGLFSRKPTFVACPICDAGLDAKLGAIDLLSHWQTHVSQIPPGQGVASGQYTWTCVCGPAGLKWEKDFAAAAGLAGHMNERHGFRLTR